MFILSLHNRPWCHLYNFTNPKCDDEASEQELLVKLWFWGHLLAFVSGKIVPWEKLPWPTEDNFIPSICLSTSHASHLSEIHSYQLSFAAMRDWQKLSDKSLSSCNTELRFQSSTMWHNYVLTKPQLDNQSKKEKSLETSEGKWTCFNLQHCQYLTPRLCLLYPTQKHPHPLIWWILSVNQAESGASSEHLLLRGVLIYDGNRMFIW